MHEATSGHLFFTDTNPGGDNLSNNGALDKINAGDIIYLGNCVTHTVLAGDRATIDLGTAGKASMPKAIIGYPGALAGIGNNTIGKSHSLFVSGFGNTINWVIAKLQLTARDDAAGMYHNFRVVGNKITAPNGDQPTGAISALGNQLYILGNELTNIGFAGTSKLYHPIYVQSAELCSGPRAPTETDREIAWNYLHDNFSYDGINIFRECGSSAYMTNHRVHDNYIANQTGCAIRIGDYVTGENWVYNNVIINSGIGPNPGGDQAMHVPLLIHAGWDVPALIHVYNNTIYGGGFTGGALWASSMVGFLDNHPFTLDFRNNIIVSTTAGVTYLNQSYPIPAGSENNIWFGAGTSPAWDANTINVNPQFVNPAANDFHLLAGSSGVDAARPLTATAALPLPALDFDAQPRPQNGVTDIGAFEFAPSVILSANWVSVNAKRISATEALVEWRVAQQQNVKEYTVQAAISNNIDFADACTVAAGVQQEYSCVVPVTAGNRYFFRVKRVDNDGRINYSAIVILAEEKDKSLFTVTPNPVTTNAVLSSNLPAGKMIRVDIYSSNGALLKKQIVTTAAGGTITIPVQQLAAGFYSLRVRYDNEQQVLKLVKE
jgi:Secretion system C-terminal sorting domain